MSLPLNVSASCSLELYHGQDSAHANQEKGRQVLRIYRYETEQVQDGRGDELVVCPAFQGGSRAVVVRFTGGSISSIHCRNMLRPRLIQPRCKPSRPQVSSCTGSNLHPMPEYINAPAMEGIFTCDSGAPVYNGRGDSLSLHRCLEAPVRFLDRSIVQRSAMGSKPIRLRTSIRSSPATARPESGLLGKPFLGTYGVSVRSISPQSLT